MKGQLSFHSYSILAHHKLKLWRGSHVSTVNHFDYHTSTLRQISGPAMMIIFCCISQSVLACAFCTIPIISAFIEVCCWGCNMRWILSYLFCFCLFFVCKEVASFPALSNKITFLRIEMAYQHGKYFALQLYQTRIVKYYNYNLNIKVD